MAQTLDTGTADLLAAMPGAAAGDVDDRLDPEASKAVVKRLKPAFKGR